ncbi:hypothetical protein MRB53_031307 [Persea americana]|uniref:Uncharacterized protein n=1 Tax=Persea americana TaxID=3435 RepID=A0ACC2KNP5_PERAE|nr:hypothetical protein MRB53_031307 [Persea americana]
MKKTHFMSTPKPDLSAISLSMARKNRPRDLLRRLRQYFLYSKLRSLLPPQPLQLTSFVGSTEMATEYEPPRHEIPRGDFDEDKRAENNREEKEAEGEAEEDEDDVRMDDSLLISTVVLKDVALSSSLFRLLEEEKLNIIFENQYRTETKVSHTLQVRVPLEYDVDVLERKLQKWARTGTHL